MTSFDDGDLDILIPGDSKGVFSTSTILQKHRRSVWDFVPTTTIVIASKKNKQHKLIR